MKVAAPEKRTAPSPTEPKRPDAAGQAGLEGWGWTPKQRIGLGVLVGVLLFFLLVQYVRRPFRLDDGVVVRSGERLMLPLRIDPNVASAAELGRIPHVGETLAKRIVEYRDARKPTATDGIVFRQPEDLDSIPGIGKRLVDELRPFLQFPTDQEVAQ